METNGIFDEYINEPNPEKWSKFPDLMCDMGFKMDCYNSAPKQVTELHTEAYLEKDRQDFILDELDKCEARIVGNYIFSRYRELTHWSDYGYPEEKGHYFFKRAFRILERKMSEKQNIDETKCNRKKMEHIKEKVQQMMSIISELEADFPGRHFTLDGHLVGSIGEVMASYYYGIELYSASTKTHDGEVDGRKVQIKTVGQDNVVIKHEPDYLIVLYLRRDGELYEVYNGPGRIPWENASKKDSNNNRHMRVNKLMEWDKDVTEEQRISSIHTITKMKNEYKNKR